MISLKVKSNAEDDSASGGMYGYATSFQLNTDQLAALGIDKPLATGTPLLISAKAFIKSSSQSIESDGDINISMSIQLTDIGLTEDSDTKAQKLYSKSDMNP